MLDSLRSTARTAVMMAAVVILLAALIAPPVTYFIWREMVRIDHIRQAGVAVEATIMHGRISSKDNQDHYYFDLSWPASDGTALAANDRWVSDAYGARVASRAGLKVRSILVKYLPDQPSELIFLDDTEQAHLQDGRPETVRLGAIISVAAWLGIVPMLMLRSRIVRRMRAERAVEPVRAETAMVNSQTLVMFLVLLGATLSVLCSDEGRAKGIEAFGASPLGLPAALVVPAIATLLLLPMIWPLHHGVRLSNLLVRASGLFGLRPVPIAGASDQTPRVSTPAILFGAAYFVLLIGAWIVYAAHRGI